MVTENIEGIFEPHTNDYNTVIVTQTFINVFSKVSKTNFELINSTGKRGTYFFCNLG